MLRNKLLSASACPSASGTEAGGHSLCVWKPFVMKVKSVSVVLLFYLSPHLYQSMES
jgi:hypothetical protein